MARKALSVTLDTENIHWLRGQQAAGRTRGLSETLNRIVTRARLAGDVSEGTIRSVVGTIDAHPDDAGLDQADSYVRALFDASLRQPIVVRESPAHDDARRKKTRRG
jgi:hypothetical protein